MILNYITWNVDPEIFNIGLSIRYYGLLWALSFIVSGFIMEKIFRRDGKDVKFIESLTLYIIVGTVAGARLGHCFFYNEALHYFRNPIEILYIWEGGLASHGAAIGIVLSVFLYNRKHPFGFLWTLDRLVIVVALAGCFIRFGNLMNSEIVGKPTNFGGGFVFVQNFESWVEGSLVDFVEDVNISTGGQSVGELGNIKDMPNYTIEVKYHGDVTQNDIDKVNAHIINNNQAADLNTQKDIIFLDENPILSAEGNTVVLSGYGIPRHASQLYESISSLLIFLILFALYLKTDIKKYEGRLFSIFLVVLFGLRFVYEFFKEDQVAFEENLTFNMGQILSIVPVLAGLVLLFMVKKKEQSDYGTGS